MDVADACRERGIASVAVSAGYLNPGPRAEFFRHLDAANIDLKGFSDRFYQKMTAARLGPVLETLEYLAASEVWLEITTLLIPGYNDADGDLAAECAWIAERLGPEVPLHFSAFSPAYHLMDVPRTPVATLLRARRIAHDHGLRYVYIGNARDVRGQTTYCPACAHPVVVRDGYTIRDYAVTVTAGQHGSCGGCGGRIPGRFSGAAGTWGTRRMPVAMLDPTVPGTGRHDRRCPAEPARADRPDR